MYQPTAEQAISSRCGTRTACKMMHKTGKRVTLLLMQICDVLVTVAVAQCTSVFRAFSQQFSSCLIPERTCFAVIWTTWALSNFFLISESLMQIKFQGIKNSHCKHDLKRSRNCCGNAKSHFLFSLASTLLSSAFMRLDDSSLTR